MVGLACVNRVTPLFAADQFPFAVIVQCSCNMTTFSRAAAQISDRRGANCKRFFTSATWS